MSAELATYPGYRFPAEVIHHAVWLYHLFSLSLRDIELILAERGVVVSHESIRRWCTRFGVDLAARLRKRRPKPGDTWHLDEVYLKINGELFSISGARSTSTASCSTSSYRSDATPQPPSASSGVC